MIDYNIYSNQPGMHKDVLKIAKKHWQAPYRNPISKLQQRIFGELNFSVSEMNRPIILDSGCGTGMSSCWLAKKFPNHLIIGIDKSLHRLSKVNDGELPENVKLVRADLIAQWQLIAQASWSIERHYILYPNPWPKSRALKKRFHGHPIFPMLMQLSPYLELRSNWKIYLEEFSLAATLANPSENVVKEYVPEQPVTLFEKKYMESEQAVYQLTVVS